MLKVKGKKRNNEFQLFFEIVQFVMIWATPKPGKAPKKQKKLAMTRG